MERRRPASPKNQTLADGLVNDEVARGDLAGGASASGLAGRTGPVTMVSLDHRWWTLIAIWQGNRLTALKDRSWDD